MTLTIPRFVVAGTHSGCGKTTIATGLMAALTAMGQRVQPFKVGPDFIDPTHHTKICGRISRNLDPFMMGDDGVLETFCRAVKGSDIAVIEGVMGLYDGMDGSDCSGTAHVARILEAPVILVTDVRGMSRSVHALIDGFRMYDPLLNLAGIIFNRVGSDRHRQMIESARTVPAFGWVFRNDRISIRSRHLGLSMAHETGPADCLPEIIKESCDLDGITRIAQEAPALPSPPPAIPGRHEIRARIGIAHDPAFCFYYQDNFDSLRARGANLVFFSPLSDRLPDVDGLYLGGGYPELHLEPLSKSRCIDDIRHAAGNGMPVYGECGGLMYLTREVSAGSSYRLCGILPATAEMTDKVQALGYVSGTYNASTGCIRPAVSIQGHEFHYSKVQADRDARYGIDLTRGQGIAGGKDGLLENHVIGTYTHAYFSSSLAENFVSCCEQYRKTK